MSLHIGLNTVDPKHYQGWDGALQGCENDARDMEAIAKAAGFDATMLLTKGVTADAAIAAISAAAEKVEPGDLFLLTYSGHGSQVPDKNGDEPDQRDETWVLYDRQLVDDELFALWAKFEPGVRIFVLSDSCHSGSAVRATIDAVRARGARRRDERSRAERDAHDAETQSPTRSTRPTRTMYDDDASARYRRATQSTSARTCCCCRAARTTRRRPTAPRTACSPRRCSRCGTAASTRAATRSSTRTIVEKMPPWQSPNWFTVGPNDAGFHRRKPFTI